MHGSSPPLTLRPASTMPLPAIVELFNAAYRDYLVPLQLTETLLRRMIDLFALQLDASRVGLADGRPAALALLGLREAQAWIAGVGVAPEMRGRGYGADITAAVVDEAHARGATDVWLEVLESNTPARRIYEAMGFATVKRLGVWTRPPLAGAVQPPGLPSSEIEASQALAYVAPRRPSGAPWQRATATFERGLPYYRGLAAGDPSDPDAVVLYSAAAEFVDVMELVSRDGAPAPALALLRALIARHPASMLRMVNFAERDPVAPLFAEVGATPTWWQVEMVLRG